MVSGNSTQSLVTNDVFALLEWNVRFEPHTLLFPDALISTSFPLIVALHEQSIPVELSVAFAAEVSMYTTLPEA